MIRPVRITGFRIRDGKVIRDVRQLSVSERLKRQSSTRVRIKRGKRVP